MKKFTFALGTALALLAAGTAQTQAGDLSGQWKLVGWTLPDYVPVKGHLPYIVFKGGQISGYAGCNKFSGTQSVSGGQMMVGTLNTTRMACEPAVMAQEQTFLKALSGSLKVERVADSLTLTTADGHMLNIRRSTLQPKK